MSDLRKQWAIVQKRPRPLSPAKASRIHEACKSVGIAGNGVDAAYAALVATLPRPLGVWKIGFTDPRPDPWMWICRLCPAEGDHNGRAAALDAALCHLHDAHGCLSRWASGEPCTDACEDCNGWGWRA